jgi:DNA-binding GntR family transcriptional regulator
MSFESKLSPVSTARQKLSDVVFDALCDAIIGGDLPPGERLREAQIAQALGVSRTPVREALLELESRHMVQRDAAGACYVAHWNRQILWEVATLRATLADLAVSLAIPNLGTEDYERLESLITQMEGAVQRGDYERLVDLDIRFHSAIWAQADHALLQETLARMMPQVRYFMLLTRPGDETDYPETHRQLLRMLRQRDPAVAGRAVREHILTTGERAIGRLEGEGPHVSQGRRKNSTG